MSILCQRCRFANRVIARYCGRCGIHLETAFATDPLPKPAPLTSAVFSTGTRLGYGGRYEIDRLLGRGGFGQAYLAYDTQVGRRPCVIKRLVISSRHNDHRAQIIESFAREARTLATLNTPGHPSIPEIYDYLQEDYCLVMKYIAGRSLFFLLHQEQAGLPEAEAVHYVRTVCSALAYMHSRQPTPVLHRDVKPENVMIDGEGHVWLIDFGLSKALPSEVVYAPAPTGQPTPSYGAGASLEQQPAPVQSTESPLESQAAGTSGYTPPEQWEGRAEPGSDIYALGVMLHTLLTGRTPQRAAASAPKPAQPIRLELHQLIEQATAYAVSVRPTAREFIAALDGLLPAPTLPPVTGPFIGREHELASAGERLMHEHLVVITGFAGVGKTSLASRFAQQVGDAGKIFWHTFRSGEGVEAVIARLAAFLAWHGSPHLWRQLGPEAHSGGGTMAFPTMLSCILEQMRSKGFLICLDDVHHLVSDPLFEQLIEGLYQLCRSGGAALIVTDRQIPTGLPSGAIETLAGLSYTDMRTLLHQRAVELPDHLTSELYRLTEGNAQLLMLAIDQLKREHDHTRLLARLAESTHIERYLLETVNASLSPTARAVMEALAVLLGYGGTRWAIEALVDQDRPQGVGLRQILSDLRLRHLLREQEEAGEQIFLLHSIVQAFYYADLSPRRRIELHRRAARYYEHEAGEPLRAALHYNQAGDDRQCLVLLAPDALRFAYMGHAALVRQILEALQAHWRSNAPEAQADPWHAIMLHQALGEIYSFASLRTQARTCFQTALMLLADAPPEPERQLYRARAYRGIGKLLEEEAPPTALDFLRRGLAELDGQYPAEAGRIYTRIGFINIQTGATAAALEALGEALKLLPHNQQALRAHTLVNLGIVHCSRNELTEGRRYYLEALSIARSTGNLWLENGILHNLGMIRELSGDWQGAEAEYRRALERAAQLGAMRSYVDIELALGLLETNRGAFGQANDHLERSLALARHNLMRISEVYILSSLADLRIREGRIAEAGPLLELAGQLALELDERSQLSEIQRSHALIALAEGTGAAALTAAEAALAAARENDDARGEGLSLRVRGQALGALGRATEALTDFERSAALLSDDPYEAARTALAWGQLLDECGESAAARPLLQQAAATFMRLGARHDLALVESALAMLV